MYNLKNEVNMYIENYDFKEWMQKLFDKLDELCKDVRILRNADKVLSEDDNLLDNQDFLFSHKTQIPQYRLDDEVYELRDQEQ